MKRGLNVLWGVRSSKSIYRILQSRCSSSVPNNPQQRSSNIQSISSSSPECASLVDKATDEYLSLSGDPVALLKRAAVVDPESPTPRLLLASLYVLGTGSVATMPAVIEARKVVAEALQSGRCNPREVALSLAVEAMLMGRWRFACQVLEARLSRNPGDVMMLRILHDLYFFLGESRNLRDGVGRYFQAWEPTMPGYGRVCAMLGFGLEETGAYDRAEELAMTALTLDPFDVWAVHVAAHVYEMGARRDEGERFLRETEEHWAGSALFSRHIHWHWALFNLAGGGAQGCRQATNRYDSAVSTTSSHGVPGGPDPARADPMILVDATALLWRLQLLHSGAGLSPPLPGIFPPSEQIAPYPLSPQRPRQKGEQATSSPSTDSITTLTRWDDLSERWGESLRWQIKSGDHSYVFNDIHAVMAFEGASHFHTSSTNKKDYTSTLVHQDRAMKHLSSLRQYAATNSQKNLGDDWLRNICATNKYDLASLGLSNGGHCYAMVHSLTKGASSFAPHLPLAAVSDNWAVTVTVGADVAEAMANFARGDYSSSFSALFRTRSLWHLLGGSHAQRDIFELTLLHAAVQCGEIGAATAIASERLCQRPNDGSSWWAYGAILAKAGYKSKAADAFNRAYLLGVHG